MAKSSVTKKYSVTVNGILSIDDNNVSVEIEETGELFSLNELLLDFNDKDVRISCTYDENY